MPSRAPARSRRSPRRAATASKPSLPPANSNAAAPCERLARRGSQRPPARSSRISREPAPTSPTAASAARQAFGEPKSPPIRLRRQPSAPALHLVEAPPATLYHTATLRGGQTLHHVGHIVVVGDVNPGAELIASGDILVFGRLAGVAHAGAHGDEAARVYALDLDATQLRIATYIAADEHASGRSSRPEAAVVRDGRIAIVPYDRLGDVERGAPLS